MEPIGPGQPGDFGEPERLDTTPPPSSSRARTVVVIVVIAATAVLVAATALSGALGYGASLGSQSSTSRSPAPVPSATTSSAIDWPTPKQPTPKQPTPSAGPPQVFSSSGFLADLDLDVFVRSRRAVFRIETRTGRVTRTPIETAPSQVPVNMLTLPDRVLVLPPDGGPGWQVVDGKPATALPERFAGAQQYLPGPKDRIWRIEMGGDDRPIAHLSDISGSRRYETVRAPGYGYFRSDGQRGLLYDDVGGVYRATSSGLRRVTPGTVLATGRTGFVATECTARFERASFAYRAGPGEQESRRRLGPAQIVEGAEGVLSPNGRYAAIMSWANSGPAVVVLDVVGGRRVAGWPLRDYSGGNSPLVWLPDGRLLSLQNARLTVLDPRTRETTGTRLRLPPLTQVAARLPSG